MPDLGDVRRMVTEDHGLVVISIRPERIYGVTPG